MKIKENPNNLRADNLMNDIEFSCGGSKVNFLHTPENNSGFRAKSPEKFLIDSLNDVILGESQSEFTQQIKQTMKNESLNSKRN